MESQIVNEWTAQARAEGVARALVRMLERRFKQVPEDLRAAIQAVTDADRLTAWIDLAFEARNLRLFRQKAGL